MCSTPMFAPNTTIKCLCLCLYAHTFIQICTHTHKLIASDYGLQSGVPSGGKKLAATIYASAGNLKIWKE